MDRKKGLLLAGVAVLAIVVVMAAPKFLPKDEVVLNQEAPPSAMAMDSDSMDAMDGDDAKPSITVQRSGTWKDGDSRHAASGAIDLVDVDGKPYLRFTDFDMTSGPDVYLYLTQSAAPRTTSDVEGNGVRIPVVTDEDSDARLNERGTFFVALDVPNLDDYQGVAAWCDDFNVLFGSAALA